MLGCETKALCPYLMMIAVSPNHSGGLMAPPLWHPWAPTLSGPEQDSHWLPLCPQPRGSNSSTGNPRPHRRNGGRDPNMLWQLMPNGAYRLIDSDGITTPSDSSGSSLSGSEKSHAFAPHLLRDGRLFWVVRKSQRKIGGKFFT